MANLALNVLYNGTAAQKGLQALAAAAGQTHTNLSKIGTVGSSALRRLAASSTNASRVGMTIGNSLHKGISKPLLGLPGLIGSLVGGAVVMGAKSLATQASDMNETVSKTRTIFGTSSKAIEAWAKGAARNLGMSRQQALEGASAFGNLFDQLGFGVKQATAMSKGFVQMATDAASFNNANPAEVMDAFQAATRGEYDALQRFIPTVSAATIEAEALRMTHKKSVTDLTAADKAAALYQVSVKGLGKAHGDFARTSGGFANQQRIMAANWADLRVKIGNYFLPMFTRAAKYMNTEGFPALTRIVTVLGDLGGAAGRMGRAVLRSLTGAFGPGLDAATVNLTELADWFDTHQETMIKFFIRLGDGAIALGRGITTLVTNGIRSFGNMAGAMSDTVRSVGNGIASLMEGAAKLLPPWSDARKDLLQGAADIRTGSGRAADGLANVKTRANEAADAIARKATPAFDAAHRALHKVGDEEIWKAKQRDAAARASIAIRDIGTKADGSQIKLKTWNDRTKLGAEAQKALEGRIKAARARMLEQREAGIKAGDSQKLLTKRWDAGRDALYREFRQMGLSKDEAKRLATRYSQIPKKVETKVTQPGMKGAIESAKELKKRIEKIDNHAVKLDMRFRASATKAAVQFFKTVPGEQASGFVNSFAGAGGGVLPGFTPGRDVHTFYSPTGGKLHLSGGEAVMRPEWTRAVGGPSAVARMNADAQGGRGPGFAAGGMLRIKTSRNRIPRSVGLFEPASIRGGSELISDGGGTLSKAAIKAINNWTQDSGMFGGVGPAGVGQLARRAISKIGQRWAVGMCLNFVRTMAGAPGGVRDASAAWSNARYKHRGDRRPPSGVPVYWGGGHGHIAVSIGGGQIVTTDFPRTGRVGRTSLGRLNSAWGKPYRGWANDVNGRVTSRYGLHTGGLVKTPSVATIAERGPERVLSAPQTQAFDRLVRVAETRGIGNTTVVINAPNYVGSRNELRDAMVQMVKSGHFKVLTRG